MRLPNVFSFKPSTFESHRSINQTMRKCDPSWFLLLLSMIMAIFLFTSIQQKNEALGKYKVLRNQHGELSCKCNGIGPTGGFCLKKEQANVGGNQFWCKNVAKGLRRLFHQQTVYDFGAGLGWYGKALLAEDNDGYRVASYKAFDGAENVQAIFPDGFVEYLDLSAPVHLPARDWVLSLEVAEHVPTAYEQILVQNLHRHNTKGIVLSWAVPGKATEEIFSHSRTMNELNFLYFQVKLATFMSMDETTHTSNPYLPNLATRMISSSRRNCATMQRYRGLKIR